MQIRFPAPEGVGEEGREGTAETALSLEGVARGGGADAELQLLDFMLALEETPFFGPPEVTRRRNDTEDGMDVVRFALTCRLE